MTEDQAKAKWEKHRATVLACVDHEGKAGYLPYLLVFQNHDGSAFHFHTPGFSGMTTLLLQELLDTCQAVLLTSRRIVHEDIDLKEDK